MSSSPGVDVERGRSWSTQDLMWWVALLSLHLGTMVVCLRWFDPPVAAFHDFEVRVPSVTMTILALRDGMEVFWFRTAVIAVMALLCWFLVWIRHRHGVADLVFVGTPLIAGTTIIPVVLVSGLTWRRLEAAFSGGRQFSLGPNAGTGWLERCSWHCFEHRQITFWCTALAICLVLASFRRVHAVHFLGFALWLLTINLLPITLLLWHAIPD